VVPAIICASSKAKKYEGDLGIPIILGIVFLFLFLFGIIDKLPEFVLMGSLFYLTTGLVASVKIRKKYHKSFLED
ncbi:hypothetical protein KKG48_02960, partial [Patescibacteria group bacterium]|nr:hypothetical protein [Patescibacteria group bacterium]